MKLTALHVSLLMEADRHGTVNPVTAADWLAVLDLQGGGYVNEDATITEKGRAAARQGER